MTLFRFKVMNIAMPRLNIDTNYLISEYTSGRSVLSLSKELKVSRMAINNRLQTQGIQPRGLTEAQRLKSLQTPPELRQQWAQAAHATIRGQPKSFEAKVNNAIVKQR